MPLTTPFRRLATVLGAALAISSTAPAFAQDAPDLGGLQISPAITERDQSDRGVSQAVLVRNEEDVPQRVTLRLTGLGHDLEGTPVFPESPATGYLRIQGPTELVLQPGEMVQVLVDGTLPAGEPALYAALVAEFAPVTTDVEGISTRTRLASLLLIRGERPWDETVVVESADLVATATGEMAGRVIVRNTGDVHVRPHGTLSIRSNGREVGTVELTSQRILPGYARALSGTWVLDGPLPAGPLQLVAAIDGAPAHETVASPPDTTVAAIGEPDPSGEAESGPGWPLWLAIVLLLLTAIAVYAVWRREAAKAHRGGYVTAA